MVDGRWVMTDGEAKRHKADALLAFQEAKKNLCLLRTEIVSTRKKVLRVAGLLGKAEATNEFLGGPIVEILQLPKMEYADSLSLETIRAQANALVAALKEVEETGKHARELGVGD